MRGTPYKSDINAIDTDLDEYYKRIPNLLVSAFKGISPNMTALLEEFMVEMGKLREVLSEDLKHFKGCTVSQEKEVAFQKLKDRVIECYGCMKELDNLYEVLLMDFRLSGDHSQSPEGSRRQESLIPCYWHTFFSWGH